MLNSSAAQHKILIIDLLFFQYILVEIWKCKFQNDSRSRGPMMASGQTFAVSQKPKFKDKIKIIYNDEHNLIRTSNYQTFS